jgi:DNA replication protein DnaC
LARLCLRTPKPDPGRVPALIDRSLSERLSKLAAGAILWPLLLTGPAGSGKTCAARCLLDCCSGSYIVFQNFCERLIRAEKGELESTSGFRIWTSEVWRDDIENRELVVLDEIGMRESVSDFQYVTLKRILDLREGKPFIAISNKQPRELERIYDDRVVSRLCAGTIVILEGKDRRLAK